ncbi:MAG TPA: M14 family zinc carboxypeptidase [bacterium]|nr:M14 family zinc carboxypeptidase [bacterium]
MALMKKRPAGLPAIAALSCLVFISLLPAVSRAQIRAAKDPAVKQYLKAYDERVKSEKKAEQEARLADPHRKLRPYLTLDEIYAALDAAAKNYPNLAAVSEYGRSVRGRPLKMLSISTGGGDKPRVLYSANIHGNEMAGNMICLELIRHFTEGYGHDRDVTYLLDHVDVFVIPVLNPDGMDRTVEQQVKMGAVLTLTRKNAHGVDLNRNFPFPADSLVRLKDSAGSNRKWMPNFRGTGPLSEPETRALDALFDHYRFTVHCNYHTSGGIILSPPATLPEPGPDDALFTRMRRDYQGKMFDPYVEHTELEFYPTIGSLDDYLYHRHGTLTVTMEVGKHAIRRALRGCHHGTCSPVFWASNVYRIEREIANNREGAVGLCWWALRIHDDPSLRQWRPSSERWVGEPERE